MPSTNENDIHYIEAMDQEDKRESHPGTPHSQTSLLGPYVTQGDVDLHSADHKPSSAPVEAFDKDRPCSAIPTPIGSPRSGRGTPRSPSTHRAESKVSPKRSIPVFNKVLSAVGSRCSTEVKTHTPPGSAPTQRSRSHEPTSPLAKESKSGIPRATKPEMSRETSKVESVVSQKSDATFSESTRPTRMVKPSPLTKWRTPNAHPHLPNMLPTHGGRKSAIPTSNKQGEVNNRTGQRTPVVSRPNSKINDTKKNLEIQFNLKKKKLLALKKEIMDKQKPLMDLYKTLLDLKKKMPETEGKDLTLEDIKIISYQPENEILDKLNERREKGSVDPKKIQELTGQVENIPVVCMDTCRLMVKKKLTILDSVFNEKGEWSQDQLIRKIAAYKENMRKCDLHIEKKLKEEQKNIHNLITEWQNVMMTAGNDDSTIRDEINNKLQETEHKLKQVIGELQFEKTKKIKDLERFKEIERENSKFKDKVQELTKNLAEEKNKTQAHKEKIAMVEQKMKGAKNKIREAEQAKQEYETKYEHLKMATKKAEEQWKSKEVYYENRHKELIKSTKAAESHAMKLEKERHAVNTRVDELSEKIVEIKGQYQQDMNDKNNEIETLKDIINNLNLEKEQLILKNENLRSQLTEKESQNKNVLIIERKTGIINTDDVQPKSELELELWNELSRLKEKLAKANQKLEMYATEKTRFIETMRRNEGEGDNLRQLMEKENEISTLQAINKQLQASYDDNCRLVEELQSRLKILDKQNESYRSQLTEGQKDSEDLIVMYQDKLKIALKEYEKCESELVDLKHRLHVVEQSLREHQKMVVERDQMLVASQDNKNELSVQNENLRRYVKHLRLQLTELSEDHALKLGELHCTYGLLEEKTNYVSQLESSLSCTDARRPSVSNLSSQTRGHSYVSNRSELESNTHKTISDTQTQIIKSLKKTDKIFQKIHYRKKLMRSFSANSKNSSSDVKLKPKNFSTTCNVDGDKMLEKDVINDMTIMRLTDMIINTLAHKQKQYEFVKHASTLAIYEASRCKSVKDVDERVKSCALLKESTSNGPKRDVIIEFLKSLQMDINRHLKRNATLPNCAISI